MKYLTSEVKNKAMVEVAMSDKHSSLLHLCINYFHMKFYNIIPGLNWIKYLTPEAKLD
jgi:hypothetical protein